MPFVNHPRLILASASPRRSALLSQIGLTFEIFPSEIEEPLPNKDLSPEKVTQKLAKLKARAVAERYTEGIIIGADTLVLFKKELLGKPKNREDAKSMLSRLSGKTHRVITGVALIDVKKKTETTWSEVTKVCFRELCADEIDNYIESGEAKDKAGAYGIQGRGAAFVKRIDGCYFNVVGLPLASFVEKLADNTSKCYR
ncbi:septum formation inhibitor Maf [Candidatus Poribacteria bacterium]|nr:septum formation inhibitor Maf [Candidatus Poribacteria bacterium]MYF57362.1 septum formation inhibitor Maf [Candidatus Poribacteria bacterium]